VAIYCPRCAGREFGPRFPRSSLDHLLNSLDGPGALSQRVLGQPELDRDDSEPHELGTG
jgi:hypothetical protein